MALVTAVIWMFDPPDPGDVTVAGIMVTFFASAGLISLVICRSVVSLSVDGISFVSSFGRKRTLRWTDVSTVTYSRIAGRATLTALDGQRIRVAAMRVGFATLVVYLDRHVPHQSAQATAAIRRHLKMRDDAPSRRP
jgi:hypothetical protein